jgi:hypothetical protein
MAYIDRTGRELLDRLVRAAEPSDQPMPALRSRISEFLAFVEEYRDGWAVLFTELTASAPLAEEVAELRGQLAEAVQAMLEEATAPEVPAPRLAWEAVAHAIVGAGESLANWWLQHPEVPRGQVTDWYVGVVQAAVAAAIRRGP